MKKLMMLILACAVLPPGAHAQAASVKYDQDRSVDIRAMEHWAWVSAPTPGESLAEARIRRTLASGFTAKGYAQIEERREADFLVAYRAAGGRELRVSDLGGPWRRNLRVDSYERGVLVVDVIERRTGRLAWRGSVSDHLAKDPQEADERMEKAVRKLLEKFPTSGS